MDHKCDSCDNAFAVGEPIIVIVSAVADANPAAPVVALPDDIHERFHSDCFLYEMGGGNQG